MVDVICQKACELLMIFEEVVYIFQVVLQNTTKHVYCKILSIHWTPIDLLWRLINVITNSSKQFINYPIIITEFNLLVMEQLCLTTIGYVMVCSAIS